MSEPATVTNRSAQLSRDFEDVLRDGDAEQFLHSVSAHCGDSADSPWEVLAVIDQLYRRGRLAPQLFRLARIGIERRALGFHENVSLRTDMTGSATPTVPAAQAEREQQRLRAELAQSRLEAAGHRQRALQLEQQLQQLQQQQQQHIQQPQIQEVQPEPLPWQPALQQPREPVLPHPDQPAQPLLRRMESRLPATQPQRTPHGAMTRGIWLVAGGIAIAALAAVALLNQPRAAPTLPVAAEPVAVPDRPADPVAVRAAAAPVRLPGTLSLERDRYVVGPTERQVVITVLRTGGTDGELAVEWGASSGGAKAGRDFTAPARATLMLADGQDSAQLVIPILRNAERRHTEYFDVKLLRGAEADGPRRATVFILAGAGGAPPPAGRRAGG